MTPPSTSPNAAAGAASPARRPWLASPFWRLWGWPIALGLATTSGLLSALVSDGWGDIWSWFSLGAPVAVLAWFSLVAQSPAEQPPAQR